jgi:hypothetical protein
MSTHFDPEQWQRPRLGALVPRDTHDASQAALRGASDDLSHTAPTHGFTIREARVGDVVAFRGHPRAQPEQATVERMDEATLYLRFTVPQPLRPRFLQRVRRCDLHGVDKALPLWEQSGPLFVYIR